VGESLGVEKDVLDDILESALDGSEEVLAFVLMHSEGIDHDERGASKNGLIITTELEHEEECVVPVGNSLVKVNSALDDSEHQRRVGERFRADEVEHIQSIVVDRVESLNGCVLEDLESMSAFVDTYSQHQRSHSCGGVLNVEDGERENGWDIHNGVRAIHDDLDG